MSQVIVVGGGLAGLSAAHTVLERGGRVLVLDKNAFMGGNSTKATSGINGTLTKTQITLGIKDSPQQFLEDTVTSANKGQKAEPSELNKVLVYQSGPAVDWLQDSFNLDLSLVSRLGGHSQPRTHRGKERFPGMTITYALMEKLEAIAEKQPNRARIISKAAATNLIKEGDKVIGVEFEHEGQLKREFGPVVIATGGYGADFSDNSLLKQYRPDLLQLPTTNGDHCTGDGIKMALAIGGGTVDLDFVQVHPTGLVHPDEPDAKVKFLAAEALRGVGGLMLGKDGKRFCNELGRRDYCSESMWNHKQAPYRLVLNGAGSKEIEWHCKHYVGRGLMKYFRNGEELAAEMKIPASVLAQTFAEYNNYAKTNTDPFGKKFFQNAPFEMNDEFHVAIITPVIHYCMGGLLINTDAEVLDAQNNPIPGLYATGEVCGGVHGKNRLGGSSLLDCVVFGRVSGATAARFLLNKITSSRSSAILNQIAPSSAGTQIHLDVLNGKLTIQTPLPQSSSSSSSSSSVPAPAQVAAAPKVATVLKEYTLEDIAKHNTEGDCWVTVNGKVLDVTKFLPEHPGGKRSILLFAGKDATEEFNMLHKPEVIEKYAAYAVIGTLVGPGSSTSLHASKTSGSEDDQIWTKPNNPMSLKPLPVAVGSSVESPISGGTAHILPAERAKASFDIEKLTNVFDGGPEKTKRRRWICSPTEDVDLHDKYNWDRHQLTKTHVKHFIDVHMEFVGKFNPTREDVAWMSENSMISGSLMNHYGLFLPTILGQGSDEQIMWWLFAAASMKIIGCYAQTELGHGSNVRGLQTIATYDKTTEEFVLTTPTLQSLKWWPGTLGRVATHAIVYAQLILDGKEYGVHSFMCQIRDENHRPLPGIELGDLGPKMGDHANDTGFMRLEGVRVPRKFLLSRYQHVSPQGEYIKSSKKTNDKLHYATMMFTRGGMVKLAGGKLAKAVTIATRYSCVRRQGFSSSTSTSYRAEERPIIDHQVQRYRVFKQLALAYAIKFTGQWMIDRFSLLESEGKTDAPTSNSSDPAGELTKASIGIISDTTFLKEIAATAAGLKGMITAMTHAGIEDLRKCCGGNGYLLNSGIAALAQDYAWQTTAEGDWIILMLQTARFLNKSLIKATKGQTLSDTCNYLSPLADPNFSLDAHRPPSVSSISDLLRIDHLHSLYRFRALSSVFSVGKELDRQIRSGVAVDEAWNNCAVELFQSVRAHCLLFLLSRFFESIEKVTDGPIRNVLHRLCGLYALTQLVEDQWAGIIEASQLRLAWDAIKVLMEEIRPDAIALTDAFDIPDRVLCSTIGSSDGNVYEALYEAAKRSPLNQVPVFEGYEEYLRPHLDLDLLKRGNVVPE
eukprot:TRINITY_DN301_c0_g2_i3.p1 TRINITY_DN301_c0_g2~~TRINITY_DN301_c0_g2_i3.p1  ORF type:complete len:1349 (-),score=671.96 TRINITY_DN301_c0_g2_i3:116-4162(-)